ncbi:prepilin-type N-terminal cleavage/methylation domain-containing protein [Stenotrophomonas sp. NLF4-10]|uniref:prepilin-type N-terminal cleavage/methylation domain-containing protein n=1 Tax=Stenotrophomonas sp. NLF4-10 TaxID=2918754 RepID=UPI001EFA840A|nr:prepilin-type N-terminal cleavage/methylation domain-containing protein [Stenotrophomonas sp. NLF4-10]MCG8277695.1 prepilin-type N-terminal cleavage/methylation domain-containing protein [Stenotrophomonas sp. NLF4-10]
MQMLSKRRQGGFTLVEMAVVLVIIGVIIGAVMIGRDVQRNAEYTRIKQKFVDQWVVTYNSYQQRYGAPIGDNQAAPQLMVNGAHFTSGFSGGNMTGVTPPAPICSGTDGLHKDVGGTPESDTGFDLRDLVRKAGITLPPGRGEGKEDRYAYLDTNGNPQEIRVCFGWNPPGTAYGSGNSMIITGLTPDLARSLDQMIDGKADAGNGAFRQYITGLTRKATGTGGAQAAADIGTEWAGNNTGSMTAGVTDGNTFGTATDDDQIMTVVANYKMNQ